MSIILHEQHPIITNTDHVRQICAPLFRNTKIDYFDYAYFCFKTGQTYSLWSNPWCFQDYLKAGLYPNQKDFLNVASPFVYLHNNFELPLSLDQNKYHNNINVAENYNINQRFYIINVREDYAEHYGFGSSIKTNLMDYFIYNIDMLEKFISYFLEQAKDLLANVKKESITLPDFLIKPNTASISNSAFCRNELRSDFENMWHEIVSKKNDLTERELEILSKVSSGLSSKEIAHECQISVRTVDTHIHNIKSKMNLHYKRELRGLWNQLTDQ